LNRYLKRDTKVNTGPTFEWVDQEGTEHTGADYPMAAGTPLTGNGSGTLPITEAGGAGPVTQPSTVSSPTGVSVATLAGPIAPAKALNAVNVTLPAPTSQQLVVGAPELTLTYDGTGTGEAGATTSIYAQLVDDTTGFVLNNQITPIPITLDGKSHAITEPLEILSATDRPGQHFTLQLTASTTAYQTQHAVGTVTFSNIHVVLPTVNPAVTPTGYGSVAPNGCTDAGNVKLVLPRATTSAKAMLGRRVIARGRRTLTIHLIGLGSGTVQIRILAHERDGRTRTLTRRLRACQ
jgi:ABC-2 type transport system ATP-binding protein